MFLMIAELSAIPMESSEVPLVNGIAAVVMILLLYSLSAFLTDKSEKLKLIINGKPSILIDNGAINFKELKRSSVTITDLAEMLRLKDVSGISDVLYAYLETNGEFSVILKPEKSPVTREDLGIFKNYSNMPCILISDGTFYYENMNKVGISESILKKLTVQNKIGSFEEILLCFCDENQKLFFYMKHPEEGNPPIIVDMAKSDTSNSKSNSSKTNLTASKVADNKTFTT